MPFKATHGMKKTTEYGIWAAMLNRCRNPNVKAYKHYGGRGVKVCSEWIRFENFFSDMGPRPEGKTLERKNCNGDYEPSNCCWASTEDQANNKRNSRILEYKGLKKTQAQWSKELGIPYHIIKQRRRAQWSIEQVLETPVRKCVRRTV